MSKQLVWMGMLIGSMIGSYIPALWGANVFSISSIVLGGIGAIIGIWFGFKISRN